MIADHHEQYRQCKIGIVYRALLTPYTVNRVRLPALLLCPYQVFLSGYDDKKNIANHDGAKHGTEVHIGATATKHLAQKKCNSSQCHEQNGRHHIFILADIAFTQTIIGNPAEGNNRYTDTDGHRSGNRCNAWINQIDLRTVPVHQCHHKHAGDPGSVCLPFKPVQMLRQLFRSQPILLRVVHATTMD